MFYPAVSLKGRAAFNFGPDFQHPAPKFSRKFVAWPGMADGKAPGHQGVELSGAWRGAGGRADHQG